jgi:hypothetical protein
MARKKKGEQTMSDIQKANMIEFEYNGKAYCLEYTPETIKRMEANGFNINEIGEKPATRLEQLWAGAFLAHHRKAVGDGIPEKLFKQMKRREELLKKLTEMYNATLEYLLPDEDDEGNVDWTATL